MRDALLNKGYFEVGLKEKADITIINTCTVTNTADSKSMKVIRQAIRRNENAIIVVCGCLVQNKKEEVSKIDGVDIVIGNINKSKIVDYIEKYIEEKKQEVDVRNIMNTNFEPMMLNNFNKTRAFVKIQDGCNNFCSYCIIPYTRGNVRSKDKQSVLKEIQLLVDEGHKEVVLTGIHTGNYGAEFADYKFADLLKDIVKIDKLERLRISSIEITEINDDVMEVIKENNILVDHMHIPLQSGSDAVLKRMNRKYDKEYFINKIKKLRKIRPNISITTDVIVGFPGETKEEFEETIETIKKIEFTKLHVFPYSKREGTKAAIMDGQVDENIKKKRVKILLQLSKELEYNYMEKFIGKKVIFIPEMAKEEYIIGHTGNFLNVKYHGNKNDLNKDIEVKINNIEYPYCIGSTID
jgi:threonylcarbamoyladenosine tRNA methylthiotransferase MtaB